MNVAWLRERFAHPRSYAPVSVGDGPNMRIGGALRVAAVLIPLVDRPHGLQVLLTRRTAHLHDHAGQISFPGGREEPEDGSAEATALRETEEEIGLPTRCVEVLGTISTYVTGTGYRVTPVVGLVSPPFVLAPDDFEVAEIFEVPLSVVLDPANHQRNTVVTRGARRQYYAIPHDRYYIWGATAAMLLNLCSFLTAEATPEVA
jgi:8-oxo-dGTP pyrophosphatase MutT (NUDIX family)